MNHTPIEQAALGLFCELIRAAYIGDQVGDIGCSIRHLEPYLAAQGISPQGVDLSPESIRLARRDFPDFKFQVADLRALPFEDESLAGVVCWYSLIFLSPGDRPVAMRELFRVVKPGDDQVRHGGRTVNLGVEFDVCWVSPIEEGRRLTDAGFTSVFWGRVQLKGRRARTRRSTWLGDRRRRRTRC